MSDCGEDWLSGVWSDGEDVESSSIESVDWICPFGGESFVRRRELDNHLNEMYGIPCLESLAASVSPVPVSGSDRFHHFCVLINYIRRKHRSHHSQISDSAKKTDTAEDTGCVHMTLEDLLDKWQISSESPFWKDEQLLLPVLPDDQVLCGFQDYDDDNWSSSSTSEGEPTTTHKDPYKACKGRFVVQGELPPSQEFLQEQERRLRELGAFDF
eukprot:Protomagalhaensia_wolfi_Nauph_80__6261@NODE_955_length_1853_cov_189_138920_g722_i0_p2_GENE_NODE_955_length_1853_cov_189_138920_g722_i0NODE_955_length_1853_cov_189_138920_g722_i0_p2_ORF_typecomplete_len213_score46_35_NODE_955_length_1853_cov_189_138920_g722_i08451483